MSRPERLPSWCDDDAPSKVIEMNDTKKLTGWIDNERMPFQYLNWLLRHIVRWFTHIDQSVNQFDPHASLVPDQFLNVTAGRIAIDKLLVTQPLQQIDFTGLFPTSASTSRIDRIVIDNATGAIERVAGTEAGSPVIPDIPTEKNPICNVLVDDASTSVTSAMITDERGLQYKQYNPVVSNHVRAGNSFLKDGSVTTSSLNVVAATTSYGPTGSGADTIWTQLDSLPANARFLIVTLSMYVQANASGTSGVHAYAASGNVTLLLNTDGSGIGDITTNNVSRIIAHESMVYIPLDSDKIFQAAFSTTGSPGVSDVDFRYRGFVVDQ